jgi:hypothetical protein
MVRKGGWVTGVWWVVLVSVFCVIPPTAWAVDRGPIEPGETRSGTIAGPDFTDTWTFYGDGADLVVINAVPTSGALDTRVQVSTPSETVLGPRGYDDLNRPYYLLVESGIYTVQVRDHYMQNSGNYNITVLKVPGGLSSLADPDGGAIASGQTLTGAINAASDLDAYQFYGQAGERVLITVVPTSGTLGTHLDLYSPERNYVNGLSPPEHKANWYLNSTGVYTLVVDDYQFNRTGEYAITVVKFPGPVSSPGDPDGGAIASGEVLSGTIDGASDMDAYQFYVTTWDEVVINAVKLSGELDTYMDLYDSTGQLLNTTYPSGDQLSYSTPSGFYTVMVFDDGLNRTGEYQIDMTKTPSALPPGVYHPSPGDTIHVSNLLGWFAWDEVEGATGYAVYFSDDVLAPFQKLYDNLTSPSLPFPTLAYDHTYYWNVVAHTPAGDIQGPYWWFQTSTTCLISGTVTENGVPLSGVTVTLAGAASGTTTSGANGNYQFTGLTDGAYTVTPSMAQYVFDPPVRNVNLAGMDMVGQNFSGAASGSLTVTITPQTAITAGAQWRVDGGAWKNSGVSVAELTVGPHVVEFKDVTGWTEPINQTVTIFKGRTTTTSGAYVADVGSLTVTITPAGAVTAGAQWQVDGGAWQNSGATVSSLSVGSHTVAYKDLANWTKPVNQSVTIVKNQTATATGTYVAQSGSLTVAITPAGAVSAGAQWRVDGGAWQNSGATLPGLSVGSHTVTFKDIADWATPAAQSVTIVNAQTASATGNYVAHAGSLTVTITPVGAVSAGAQWQVDGGAWQNSGATLGSLAVGAHTVAFKDLAGWTKPVNQSVTIVNGQTTTSAGTYVLQTGSLSVTIAPAGAVAAGAQWQVDSGALQNSGATVTGLTVGPHTVAFKAIPGWNAPVNQSVTIIQNQTTTATATYVQQVVKPTVTIQAADAKASEPGKDKGKFVVSRSGATTTSLKVYYKASGTAKNGIDYRKLGGVITIPIGKPTATLVVTVLDDKIKERGETVKVNLLSNPKYLIGSLASATVKIADNE